MMEGIEIAFNLQPFPHKTFKLLSGCREGRTGSVNSEQGHEDGVACCRDRYYTPASFIIASRGDDFPLFLQNHEEL